MATKEQKGDNLMEKDVEWFELAKEYGVYSKEWAVKAGDDVWQLNAGVLVAQACSRWQHRSCQYYDYNASQPFSSTFDASCVHF